MYEQERAISNFIRGEATLKTRVPLILLCMGEMVEIQAFVIRPPNIIGRNEYIAMSIRSCYYV